MQMLGTFARFERTMVREHTKLDLKTQDNMQDNMDVLE